MMDAYKSSLPEYRPYILRARKIRSDAIRSALGFMFGAILNGFRRGYKKMKCRRIQRRAEKELRGLSSAVLKDMGVSRSDITWKVREAMPCL